MIESIKFIKNKVIILDQTLLPKEEQYITINNYKEMIDAIKKLRIRGAPAIGIAAAFGCWLASLDIKNKNYFHKLIEMIKEIEQSRPTAVNLFYATNEVKKIIQNSNEFENLQNDILDFAKNLMLQEKNSCFKMGQNGADWIINNAKSLKILTHCNTGSLATYGIGTALGVIRSIHSIIPIEVFVDETRPLLQGARLTAWECRKSNINYKLITDNMAAHTIKTQKIDVIITGADRIAKNGDSANKIGTFNLAILAKYFNIPFYIVAPETTIDRNICSGEEINIEQRDAQELIYIKDVQIAPTDASVFNPAFDVVPAELISGIITEKKVYTAPYNF